MNNKTDKSTMYLSTDEQKYIDSVLRKYQKNADKFCKMHPTSQKTEQIQTWVARINKMKSVIQKTLKNSSLTPEEKQAKIQNCLEIIRNTEFSLRSMLEFLEHRIKQNQSRYEKLSRIK